MYAVACNWDCSMYIELPSISRVLPSHCRGFFTIIALQHSKDMDRVKDEQKLVLNEDEN